MELYVRDYGFLAEDDDIAPTDWLDDEEDAERIAAWRAGEWSVIGITATVELACITGPGETPPAGPRWFDTYYTRPAGCTEWRGYVHESLWGIESDAGDDYIAEVKRELMAEVESAFQASGFAWSYDEPYAISPPAPDYSYDRAVVAWPLAAAAD